MAIAVTDRIRRGESGNSPFAVAWQDDLKIAFLTVADITARDAIQEWKRLPYMTVYVISTNIEYTLGTNLTIAGQVWTEKSYGLPDNVVTEDEIFDSEGYIQPQLIKNIFLNTSYVVANEAAMLALVTYTGNFVIRTDTSEVYIKLNNDDPADISDFALASGGSGVISVNGSTGVVSVTIASLLAVGANQTAFDSAVTTSPTVAANTGAILTLQSDLTTLQGDLADLDDYVQTHLGIQALSSAAQTPTGGDVGKSLIWNGTNYDLSLISGGGSGLADPMTTRGDLIFRNSSNVTARLPIGTATYVLTSDGTDVAWAAPSSSFTLVAGNGTTVNGTGDGVDLGGTLTGDVEIDGDNTYSLSSYNLSSFQLQSINDSEITSGGNLTFDVTNDILLAQTPPTATLGDILTRNTSTGALEKLGIGSGLSISSGNLVASGGGLTVGTSTITSGTNTKVLYNNSGVLGEYTVSGTGNVALTTSPTFTTPALGTPSALVGTNITGTATGLTSGITNALKSATTTVNVSSATAPTSGQVLTATSGTAATWQTPASASGAWLLASGGTATGTNTFAMGSNPFILTSGVTTGTGATAGIQNVFNSLTTGNGLDISSSSVSSGAIVKITGTGTAAASNTQSGLVVDVSGANATSTQTTYGGYFNNTKTGTSSTNIAGYFNASGGTNNLAIYAPSGIVTLGSTGAGYNGRLYSTAGTGGRVALFGNLEITTSVGPGWSGTGLQVVGSNRKISFYGGNWGTDNDQVDISWNATGVNRSGVDLGVFKSSLGSFSSATFQANSIAGFRFIDTWPTLTTPLNVVYGFDYSAGGAGNAVSEVAIRATSGQVVLGATGTSSANDRVKINGIGTTTGKGLVVNNSSGSERFSVQDDGVINVNGSGGTAGQVLVSNGTSAAAWGTPTVNITGSNQRYQTQVVNISSSLVASGTGFAGLSNPSEYANKSVLSVDFVIVMIKNDGTAVVYGKLTSIFRKNNSGTWTADVPGTPTISDITQLSGFVGDINGGVPGITWTTPGTTSGTWQLGYTAAISSTTN